MATRRDTQRGRPARSASVRDELSRRIEDGRLPGGARLPSEPDLAAELGVSRATLREALHALELEGMLRRMRGSGTFVLDRPRVANSLDLNFGVTEAIRAAGMEPGTRDARHWVEPAGAAEAERLGVEPGRDLVVLERIRTADGRPVVVSRDVLPRELLAGREGLVERMLAGSLYDVLAGETEIAIDYGLAGVRPIRADSAVGGKLGVPRGELLLYLWQVDYTEEGAPVLLSHEYHLADAFEFSFVRRGRGRRLM